MQAAFSQKPEIFPAPKVVKAVNDYADIIDAEAEKSLEQKLKSLRSQTKPEIQIAVVTVKTTGKQSIFDASLATAQGWAATAKDSQSDGLLIFIAADDRKYFTQTSSAIQKDLPDNVLGDLQRTFLVPAFREKKYAKGLTEAIDAIIEHLAQKRGFTFFPPINKVPTPPAKIYSFDDAKQMILVTTPNWNAMQGSLQRYERENSKSEWRRVGDEIKIVIGRSGLAWGEGLHDKSVLQSDQPIKKEGDGKSPAGIFALTSAFGTTKDTASIKLPYTPLGEYTECVDDVKSASYNRIVDRLKIGNFDWKSSEKMLEVGEQYSLGVFVAHNSNPPEKGKGSCIFLHIWKDENSPTAGCTAMRREDMDMILRWLDAKQNPVLVQFPATEYDRLSKKWKLPKNK